MRDLSLQKMRLGDQLSAGRTAQDWQNNIGYQMQMANAPLQATQAETPFYGSAIGGRSSAVGNLTQLGIAAYGPWMAGIQAAGGAGAAALTGCWIAEAIYGVDDFRTHTVRAWLNGDFKKKWYGRLVMRFYLRFGERIAKHVRRHGLLRQALRPLFDAAFVQAVKDNKWLMGSEYVQRLLLQPTEVA